MHDFKKCIHADINRAVKKTKRILGAGDKITLVHSFYK
jgi:hypothetical protein